MHAISLRAIDDALFEKLKETAKERTTSVNKTIQDILREHLGLSQPKTFTEYHDLDHLFGTWSKEDSRVITDEVKRQRKVDKDLWQ
jgi:hypothetical protein